MIYQPICPNHKNNGFQHYKMFKNKAIVKAFTLETICDGMRFKTLVKSTIAVPCECYICGNGWEEIFETNGEER